MRMLSLVFVCLALAGTFVQAQIPEEPQVRSLEELTEFLKRLGINSQVDTAQGFAAIPVKKETFEAVHVIRWATADGVVHFIQVIPIKVPAERVAALESGMVRLNHSYPVPGLGYNHDTGTLYFRMTVPFAPAGYLTEKAAQEYFGYCINQAYQFVPALTALIKGEVEPDGVLDFHRKHLQEAAGPLGTWKKTFGGSEWILTINPNHEVTLRKDGTVVVDSMAKIEGNQVTFDDVNGTMASDGPGTYEFTTQNGALSFKLVQDTSTGRQQVLTEGNWTR